MNNRLPYPSLYHAFVAVAASRPDADAIRDGARTRSYAALHEASRRAARALIASGFAHGDRAGVWAANHGDWPVAGLALQATGGALIPIGTRLRPREVAAALRRTRARVLFCDPGFGREDFVAGIAAEPLPDLERIVVFGDAPDVARAIGWDAFLRIGDGVDEATLDARIGALDRETLADIIFTSGTTGDPKGVPMTHGQSLAACEQQQACVSRFAPGDVFAVTYPFAHNAGYRAGWQAGLLFGTTVIPVRVPDAERLLALVAQERVTHLPAVPTIFQAMLDHPALADHDVSSIRFASTGATTIPATLIEQMQRVFGLAAVSTGYGLTEAAGSVTATRPGDDAQMIVSTAGRPLDGLDVRVIDAAGAPLATGETGEIAIRGPQVMRGYYEDADATRAAFTDDGYLRTGDIGVFDAAGNLRITDRLKDMYIVGGFNAYPAEIEQQLCRMEGIAEAAVVGVDDDRLGQVGRAFVVRRPGTTIDETAVIAWCQAEMANYKVPRIVTFLTALPRNPTGKIAKADLRAIA